MESEGLHYGLVDYGGDKEVKTIKDEELTELFNRFRKTSEELENKLEKLKEEVIIFVED